jgi:hypothetical protein
MVRAIFGKYYQEIYKIYENAKHLNKFEKIYIPNIHFVQAGYCDWIFQRFL